MSEHKKINTDALRCLLRYGRKVSGPWDEVDMAGDEWMVDDDDADLLSAAPDLLWACKEMVNKGLTPETRKQAMTAIQKAKGNT